nr:MAG TPA: hypothetical protein [Caudoviricetes sp.]
MGNTISITSFEPPYWRLFLLQKTIYIVATICYNNYRS